MLCKYCQRSIASKPGRKTCPCRQPGVSYCDLYCQKKDWLEGGHRNKCDYKLKRQNKTGDDPKSLKRQNKTGDDPKSSSVDRGVNFEGREGLKNGVFKLKKSRQKDQLAVDQGIEKNGNHSRNITHPINRESQSCCQNKGQDISRPIEADKVSIPRDQKGKFKSLGEISSKNSQQAVSTRNYSDFKIVTRRLQCIIGIFRFNGYIG